MDLDTDKIIKLLNLSSSDSDGEALSAIRAANRMLGEKNVRWSRDLFGIPVFSASRIAEMDNLRSRVRSLQYQLDQSRAETSRLHNQLEALRSQAKAEPKKEVEIAEMLRLCLEKEPANPFFLSLNTFYQDKKYLTVNQREALRRNYWGWF
jgi:hypothetical protein